MSESCVQSPSVVVNVYVERRTSGGVIELTVVWDTPVYSGTRDDSELLYRVSYYKSVSVGSVKEDVLSERQFVLSDFSESTEYVIEVTSLNGVSTLSGVYNTVSVTVLSSFPDLESIGYNMTTNILEWSYSLYGNREYVFELSYISTESGLTTSVYLNMSECMCAGGYTSVCSVFVADLNSSLPISFHLFFDNSSVLTDTNLSYDYNLLAQPTQYHQMFFSLLTFTTTEGLCTQLSLTLSLSHLDTIHLHTHTQLFLSTQLCNFSQDTQYNPPLRHQLHSCTCQQDTTYKIEYC